MKSPIIIEGEPFDWEQGAKAMDNVVTDDGEINWFAAAGADPGCMKCPGCGVYLWREGTRVRCPHCAHEFTIESEL